MLFNPGTPVFPSLAGGQVLNGSPLSDGSLVDPIDVDADGSRFGLDPQTGITHAIAETCGRRAGICLVSDEGGDKRAVLPLHPRAQFSFGCHRTATFLWRRGPLQMTW
jgi:hypothetical protein